MDTKPRNQVRHFPAGSTELGATNQSRKLTDILSVEQAAAFLDVSQSTIRAHCNLALGQPDRIPNFRIGERAGTIKIPFWGLINWIAQRAGCQVPLAEQVDKRKKRRIMEAQPRRLVKMRR
jgi:hypothetical protein